MRSASRKAVMLVVLLALAGLVSLRLLSTLRPQIEIAPEITLIDGPLDAEGWPDYNAWLLERQRASVLGKPNGAIPFWQAMWPGEYDQEEQDLLRAELGVAIPQQAGALGSIEEAKLGPQFATWLADVWMARSTEELTDDAKSELILAADRIAEDTLVSMLERPFTSESMPAATAWVDEHDAGFSLLEQVVHYDAWYSPSPGQLRTPADELLAAHQGFASAVRDAVRLLQARASRQMGRHDYHQAWSSCLAMRRIGDFCQADESGVISVLVALAVYEKLCETAQVLALQPHVPEELLWRMGNELRENWTPASLDQAIDIGERICFLDALCRLAAGRPQPMLGFGDEPRSVLGPRRLAAIDLASVMERSNRRFDEIVAALRHENWQDRRDALENFERRLSDLALENRSISQFVKAVLSRKARSEYVGNLFINLFMPSLTAATAAADRANTHWELTCIAVALSRYQRQHGRYPHSLAELVPHDLPAVPVDLFHNLPYEYRTTKAGFLLYSRGPNGNDEQGDSSQLHRLSGYCLDDDLDLASLREQLADEQVLPERNDELVDAIAPSSDDIGIRFPFPERRLPASPMRHDDADNAVTTSRSRGG